MPVRSEAAGETKKNCLSCTAVAVSTFSVAGAYLTHLARVQPSVGGGAAYLGVAGVLFGTAGWKAWTDLRVTVGGGAAH